MEKGEEKASAESMKLLPCPFCGGEAEWSLGKHGDGTPWPYIECVSLGCGAIAEPDVWNTRTPAQPASEPRSEAGNVTTLHYLKAINERLHSLYDLLPDDPRLREHISDEVDWIESEVERLSESCSPPGKASTGERVAWQRRFKSTTTGEN